MFAPLQISRMAQALAAHAGLRQQAVAQNVAQSDTPGYRAQDAVPFAEYLRLNAAGRGALPPRPDDLFRPDARPATRSPDGNTVSLEHEMTRAAEIRAQHELALGIQSATRDLIRAAMARSGR